MDRRNRRHHEHTNIDLVAMPNQVLIEARTLVVNALKGEAAQWPDDGRDGLLERDVAVLVRNEGLAPLLLQALHDDPAGNWPDTIVSELAQAAARATVIDVFRCRQLTADLARLSEHGVRALIFKGAALAHQIYPAPGMRPRADTDLLVEPARLECAREALLKQGYLQTPAPNARLTSTQMLFYKMDAHGVGHSIDLHWRLFNRPRYSCAFTFESLWQQAERIPALGTHAYGAGKIDALILACVHRLAHHSSEARIVWLMDIDLLARRLTTTDWTQLEATALKRDLVPACATGLLATQASWGTNISSELLSSRQQASIAETRARRDAIRWRQWIDNLRYLPDFRSRATYVYELAFPGREFMDAVHPGRLPLWARYLYRNVKGALAQLSGSNR